MYWRFAAIYFVVSSRLADEYFGPLHCSFHFDGGVLIWVNYCRRAFFLRSKWPNQRSLLDTISCFSLSSEPVLNTRYLTCTLLRQLPHPVLAILCRNCWYKYLSDKHIQHAHSLSHKHARKLSVMRHSTRNLLTPVKHVTYTTNASVQHTRFKLWINVSSLLPSCYHPSSS